MITRKALSYILRVLFIANLYLASQQAFEGDWATAGFQVVLGLALVFVDCLVPVHIERETQ